MWLHQDGDVNHSRLESPSQEHQLTTTHRQDTILKNSEPGGEAEAPLWTTETEKDHIERLSLGLWFPQWEKEN